ncbi:hypothetical protein [Allomesorhizobium alhagi]|uniref:hypothetical protein n=1 Tax=Allomesorhizobium alhagi TaxID=475067 RepID=UPI003B58712F
MIVLSIFLRHKGSPARSLLARQTPKPAHFREQPTIAMRPLSGGTGNGRGCGR